MDDRGTQLDHGEYDAYKGGSAPPTISASWGTKNSENSEAVELDAFLVHDANYDRFQALPRKACESDLKPVWTLYQVSYGMESDSILLHIQGQDVSRDDPIFVYSFGIHLRVRAVLPPRRYD